MNKKQKMPGRALKKQVKRQMKLAVVPHKGNHYRPHLIRRYGIAVLLVFVVVLQLGHFFPDTGVLGQKAPVSSQALLNDMNIERAKNNLKPLSVNEKLSNAAFLKASDMFKKQYWAHVAPDGVTPWQWFSEAGYNYTYAGENLAKNFQSSRAVTNAWLASKEHRANVLGPQYSEVGFAVVNGELEGESTTVIVALYGLPASATVAGTQSAAYEQAAKEGSLSLATRFGIALQSMAPGALASVVLLMAGAVIATAAHFYRHKLPKHLRQSWYRHHGAAKAGGMLGLGIVVILLYGGGQI